MIGDYASFESEGFEIESNTRTADQMKEALTPPKPPEEPAAVAPEGEAAETPTETTPEPEKPLGKPRHDMKARMLDATRKESEAKKRADEIERRANALEAELARLKAASEPPPAKPEPPKKDDTRPKLDEFETLEDHAEAVANWVADKREKAAREAAVSANREKQTEERFASFAKRMEEHVKADPDFWSRQDETVVQLRPTSVLSQAELAKAGPLNALADHFLVSDQGPALIEYFSGKPEELQRLSTLHPAQFWRELGRIEERLPAATTATVEETPKSKAAPPARPVTGGPATGTPDPNKMSFEEYFAWQNKEDERVRKLSR